MPASARRATFAATPPVWLLLRCWRGRLDIAAPNSRLPPAAPAWPRYSRAPHAPGRHHITIPAAPDRPRPIPAGFSQARSASSFTATSPARVVDPARLLRDSPGVISLSTRPPVPFRGLRSSSPIRRSEAHPPDAPPRIGGDRLEPRRSRRRRDTPACGFLARFQTHTAACQREYIFSSVADPLRDIPLMRTA